MAEAAAAAAAGGGGGNSAVAVEADVQPFDVALIRGRTGAEDDYERLSKEWKRADGSVDDFDAVVRVVLPRLQFAHRLTLTTTFFETPDANTVLGRLQMEKLARWLERQKLDAAGWRMMCMIAWCNFIETVIILNSERLCEWAKSSFVAEPGDYDQVRKSFREATTVVLPVLIRVASEQPAMLRHLLWMDEFWEYDMKGDDALSMQIINQGHYSMHGTVIGKFHPTHPLWDEFKRQWDIPVLNAMTRAAFRVQTTLSGKMAADAADLVAHFLAPVGTSMGNLRVSREVYNASVDLARAHICIQRARARHASACATKRKCQEQDAQEMRRVAARAS